MIKIKQTTTNKELLEASKEYSILLWDDRKPGDNTPINPAPQFIDGALWAEERHNSKPENLWQTLNAFKITMIAMSKENTSLLTPEFTNLISLVDQCLEENKPTSIL